MLLLPACDGEGFELVTGDGEGATSGAVVRGTTDSVGLQATNGSEAMGTVERSENGKQFSTNWTWRETYMRFEEG